MSDQAQQQTTLWDQRRLRSKLHLPFFTADIKQGVDGMIDYSASLDTITARPLCGRQLNNHRAQRSQLADKLEFAQSLAEFTYQLLGKKACTHCARKAGLLVEIPELEEEDQGDEN